MKDVTPTNTHVPDTLPDDGDVARLSNASIHDDLAASSSFPVHVRPPPAPSILPEVPPSSAHDDMWTSRLKGEWTEETGMHKMGLAGASHLHSVLEGTLHQITELAESQEHLLSLVTERNVHLVTHPALMVVEQTMAQLPSYFQKVIQLKLKMNDITTTLEKLKSRADHLQVEAQSRALAKEDRHDKQSQWQRLFSASKSPPNDLATPPTTTE
ncbi:hypothetical protein DYB36_007927 [Aphanomyces astaci]|uniref:Uncharacterized protein n=1 Tax=Aphanomyces astaci TaxID=112090 RepID=A0A397A8N7_APHAT|nr:hypothetical protein DYB36_007927 [Aphanomyces astaci]